MFGTLGGQEIIFILVLALIVFGPRKLPEIGKSIGRMMAEFRKASNDFRRTLEEEVEAEKVVRPAEPPPTVETPSTVEPPANLETPAAAEPTTDDTIDAPATLGPPSSPPADAPASAAPAEPTVSRPEPTGVGRPDGRPAE